MRGTIQRVESSFPFLYDSKVAGGTRSIYAISAFVPFSNILYATYCKAPSNPICPHSWPSFEQGVGQQSFRAPSQPELLYALRSYDPVSSPICDGVLPGAACKNHGLFYLVWLWVHYCSQHCRSHTSGWEVNEKKGRQVHLTIQSILSRQRNLLHIILSLGLANRTL